jgi:hypothetical protein
MLAEPVLEAMNMSSPFKLRAPAMLVLALSLAACTDPLEPGIRAGRPALAVLLRAGTASDLQVCVTDVLERITPVLEQSDDLNKVRDALLDVSSALEKRHPPQLLGASRTLNDALDKYMSADEARGLDPDAAVLRLLSEDVEKVALYPPLDTLRTN